MATFTPNAVGKLYAQALIELADEQGQLDAVADEVAQLGNLLHDDADLNTLLETPALSTDERAGLLQRLFDGKVSDVLYKLLQVMNLKGRVNELPALVASFAELMDDRNGVVAVDAYVAAPMDAATLERVKAELGTALGGKTVKLEEHIDESLIGGLKVKIGDKLVDASVASQLRAMRNKLVEAGRGRASALASG